MNNQIDDLDAIINALNGEVNFTSGTLETIPVEEVMERAKFDLGIDDSEKEFS